MEILGTDKIREIAINEGAVLVGFSSVEDLLPKRLSRFKNAISIAFYMGKGIFSEVQTGPTFEYFHHYRTVNKLIDNAVYKIALEIERAGFSAYPVAASQSTKESAYSGIFPHKTGATRGGIGWIGKSAILVTEQYGGRVRFGTILTDMDFDKYNEAIVESKCGDCDICVTSCPAGAISGENWKAGLSRESFFDAEKCSNHMKSAYKHIGRGAVCGICIGVCPHSK